MSDSPSNNPNLEQLDEELVAYLDGELSSADARRVEDLLAVDTQARNRLNQLAASWDLLDQLPRATLDDSFTHTTVEMVALAAEEELAGQSARSSRKQTVRWLIGALATVAAACVGFAIIGLLLPNRNEQLLDNLPIVANFELYRNVGNVDVLNGLRTAGLFGADKAGPSRPGFGSESRGDDAPAWSDVPAQQEARRLWVEQQSAERKLELNRNFERFIALPTSQQDALRKLASAIAENPEASQLKEMVRRYYQWLARLSPVERAELSDKPADERVAEVQRMLRSQEQGTFARVVGPFGFGRSFEAGRNIRSTINEITKKYESELLANLPESQRQPLVELREKKDRGANARYMAGLTYELLRSGGAGEKLVTSEDLQPLVAQLPDEYKRKANKAETPPEKLKVVRGWIDDVARGQGNRARSWGRGGQGRPPRQEDLDRFRDEKLSKEEREKLAELPEDEARMKLLRLYIEYWRQQSPSPDAPNRQFRRGDGDRRWEGDPPRGGPPPRGNRGSDRGPERSDRGPDRAGRDGDRPPPRRPPEDFRRPPFEREAPRDDRPGPEFSDPPARRRDLSDRTE